MRRLYLLQYTYFLNCIAVCVWIIIYIQILQLTSIFLIEKALITAKDTVMIEIKIYIQNELIYWNKSFQSKMALKPETTRGSKSGEDGIVEENI